MTAAPSLQSLTLTAFRGAAATFKLDFEKGRKLTLIYGENGTGKTTICDAFEFLAKDNIGSLDHKGLGPGVKKYWRTVGKPATEFAVELLTSDGYCTGKLGGNMATVITGTVPPRIQILRRRQIVDFVETQPAKRYEAIKHFIDIETFERSEEALRQQGKALASEKMAAVAAEQENLNALQGFYEAAGSPEGLNPVTWANQKLAEPTTGLETDIAAIAKLRTDFDALKSFPEKLEIKRADVTTAQTNADAADQAQTHALATVDSAAAERVGVLSAGQAYLEAHPEAESCPLCESDEKIAGLAETLKATLVQLGALTAANAKRKLSHAALISAKAAFQQVENDYAKAVTALATAQTAHQWQESVKLPTSGAPVDATDLPNWLTINQLIADVWANVEAGWREETRFRASLKSAADRYDTNAARVTELTALIPNVEAALAQCLEERQKFTDSIIGEIAEDVGKLYEKVHEGEGLNKIVLELDTARRASLNLGANFEGHDAPPQAYFSQSHLDTLGLCVFLALAVRDRAHETVLILDDVLGSVDEPHVERVIGMVYDVSAGFQHTIVTTHYRPWREKYRWGRLKPDQMCQFIELKPWDISSGLAAKGARPEILWLKKYLSEDEKDLQTICAKAGVILEEALDYLTCLYECRLPRRDGAAYTLGELLDAVSGKLRSALIVEVRHLVAGDEPVVTKVALLALLDELSGIAKIRNAVGAHFNKLAFEMPEADTLKFGGLVEQLADALVCPDHGWPSNDKSGSYWRNSGDTRRLHPLKKPA